MTKTNYTILVKFFNGEEISINNEGTLKQTIAAAKKESRKMINNKCTMAFITILAVNEYNILSTVAYITASKEGRKVVFSDEETEEAYNVCWGVEYTEEDKENNVIFSTSNKEEAKEIAENESKENKSRMCVVRKSDNKVIAKYDNTTTATETATEENELSNAGYCLDVYLNNDVDIYTKLTEPAIKAAAMGDEKLMEVYVINALKNAADLVRVNDGLKPTQKDIETVKAGYVAYILECAQYQNEMA